MPSSINQSDMGTTPSSTRSDQTTGVHTPTPWRITGRAGYTGHGINSGNKRICSINSNSALWPHERDANAAFIVRAVHCHDELVGALKKIVACDDYAPNGHGLCDSENYNQEPHSSGVLDGALALARSALSKALGTEER